MENLIGSGGALEGAGDPDRVEDVEVLVPRLDRQLQRRPVVPDDDVDEAADARAVQLGVGHVAELVVPHERPQAQPPADQLGHGRHVVEEQVGSRPIARLQTLLAQRAPANQVAVHFVGADVQPLRRRVQLRHLPAKKNR